MRIQAKSIQEIDRLLKSKTGYEQLVSYCETVFKALDKIHYRIKAREIVEGSSADEVLDKVTGYAGFLRPIYESLEAYKKNEQEKYFVNRLEDSERNNEKFTLGNETIKASHYVANLRVLRNRLRGYVKQCDIDIGVLQSKLKYYAKID
jgi:hypothetical protein